MTSRRGFVIGVLVLLFIGTVSATTVYIYPLQDNYVQRVVTNATEETYDTIRNGVGTSTGTNGSASFTTPWTRAGITSNKFVRLGRGILTFDTSIIGSDSTITSVNLSIVPITKSTGIGTPDMGVTGGTPTSYTTIAASDYNKTSLIEYAPRVSYNLLTNGTRYNFTFTNTSGIDKGGYTALYLRDSYDLGNVFGGNWSYYNQTYSGHYGVNNSVVDVRPYLEVTYTAGSTGAAGYGAINGNDTGYAIGGSAYGGGTEYPHYSIGDSDCTATTAANLATCLAAATPGDIVYIASGTDISLDGTHVHIPGGVTLASDRGHAGSAGGKIHWSTTSGGGSYMLNIDGDDARITGLQLEGPSATTTTYYRSAIDSIGHTGLEVDNCEIYNWPMVGVSSRWETAYDVPITTNATVQTVYVHHNYIHHIQGSSYGYGVNVRGGHGLIEANIFDYNRHSISSPGYANETYEARFNLNLGGTSYGSTGVYYQDFDVHGYTHDPGDGWQRCDQTVGDYYYIHHNTWLNCVEYAIGIRAVPTGRGVYVTKNIVAMAASEPNHPAAWQRTIGDYGGIYMSDNYVGRSGATPTLVSGDGFLYRQGTLSSTLPDALFSASPLSGSVPLTVHFTDESHLATNHYWDFNNDGIVDSTTASPTYTYTIAGNYTVNHTVTNSAGSNIFVRPGYIWESKTGLITAGGIPPVAAFSGTPLSGHSPLTVTFTDASTNSPTSWSWDFGDGVTNTTQNPVHVYNSSGVFDVTLTATNAQGSDSETKANYVTINDVAVPVAGFVGTPLSGARPLTVTFTDTSLNSPASWLWDFGDGNTSVLQNPSHIFYTAGPFTVTLTSTNTAGSDSEVKAAYIITTAPTAAPTPTPTITDSSGNPIHPRAMAPGAIPTIPNTHYLPILGMLGLGDRPINTTPNWSATPGELMSVYTDYMGPIAFLLVFLIPFGMMWLAHGNMKLLGILGMIVGGFVFLYLPSNYVAASVMAIAIGFAALLWGVFKQ